jgi:protein-tyrosine-phosphatase
MPHVVTLCTGNAARSVIAGALLADAPGLLVSTRGTHVIEGLPMSVRTSDAIKALGASSPGHRSRQLSTVDLATADLVVAMEIEHVAYVRRHHPEAAQCTATLRRLARDLPNGSGTLAARVAVLDLANVTLEPWEDVADPAGGDAAVFQQCAAEILELLEPLLPLFRDVPVEERA